MPEQPPKREKVKPMSPEEAARLFEMSWKDYLQSVKDNKYEERRLPPPELLRKSCSL